MVYGVGDILPNGQKLTQEGLNDMWVKITENASSKASEIFGEDFHGNLGSDKMKQLLGDYHRQYQAQKAVTPVPTAAVPVKPVTPTPTAASNKELVSKLTGDALKRAEMEGALVRIEDLPQEVQDCLKTVDGIEEVRHSPSLSAEGIKIGNFYKSMNSDGRTIVGAYIRTDLKGKITHRY